MLTKAQEFVVSLALGYGREQKKRKTEPMLFKQVELGVQSP
jgi:hypothetical protein